ncbi:hypothetical protein [Microbacterium sp.]|uniref:hypothetical protein n=1 Tax=Microbacterium sp. TaxID=51671 RepID=UPI002732F034|nr:hypothetical protein [Microbacterium sp.]MDP3950388.1 hypothetical protein [Microbacterium sp.]
MTTFVRLVELPVDEKDSALRAAVRGDGTVFKLDPSVFAQVPGSPFAYWVSADLRKLFAELPRFENQERFAYSGTSTGDDDRFTRTWWEVASHGSRWRPYTKGGLRSPYYADIPALVDWKSDGIPIEISYAGGRVRKKHFGREALTWPLRGVRFSAQAVPAGCIFGTAGKVALSQKADLPWLLALFNSQAFDKFIAFFAGKVGGVQYEVGLIQNIPVPDVTHATRNKIANLGRRAWSIKRLLDTGSESSHSFALPALLQVRGNDLGVSSIAWFEYVRKIEGELSCAQSEIDARCFELYGLNEADRRAISEGLDSGASDSESEDHAGDDSDETEFAADETSLAAELVSWTVGVAFGRFDVSLATGARPMPSEPEPFDPLPVCSPGILASADGLPLARPPAGYPLTFPENGVLVDDPGHAQDLLTAVRVVFDLVFGVEADRWWNDVAARLDPKGHDLRAWLTNSFFEHHLKRYSKSRRKAPILWQLGTSSGRYSVWLYAHRLTRDSFFQLQNEVVGPKLAHEERQLTSLIENAGGNPSASERKAIAAQEAFVEELRTMLDEVKRVAPLWNPNLDDGVVLTMAPLWRLVPQHKSWQKELKSKWDELAAGKYDWAHVAMHLWPERAVPNCATDRSLAIAHGLEDIFWVEVAAGKWKARTTPLRSVEELVCERSSPAVKAALKSLLDAPTTSGNGRVRGGRRATSAAATVGGSR